MVEIRWTQRINLKEGHVKYCADKPSECEFIFTGVNSDPDYCYITKDFSTVYDIEEIEFFSQSKKEPLSKVIVHKRDRDSDSITWGPVSQSDFRLGSVVIRIKEKLVACRVIRSDSNKICFF